MVRTAKSHHQDEEDDDAEDVAAGTDTSSHREGKSAEPKPSNPRSKHSETEQRRRSKINERFQILRDLIPPNDQKRDKASLLLEVIEYIQFLHEKLQVYEGSYQQVWNEEPTKLIPWRANHGPVENIGNHSQVLKNGSVGEDENNALQPMTSIHGSLEPEFSGEFAYGGLDHLAGPENSAVPLSIPMRPCAYPPGKSTLQSENLASQLPGSSIAECAIIGNESRTFESGSSSISSVYSRGLLNKLTQALQTSGVDLSQTNISVQLDVAKRAHGGSTAATSTAEDVCNQPGVVSGKGSFQAGKRLRRTEES